jgi:hypothetical protein
VNAVTTLSIRAQPPAPGGRGVVRVGGDHIHLMTALAQAFRAGRAHRADTRRLGLVVVAPQLNSQLRTVGHRAQDGTRARARAERPYLGDPQRSGGTHAHSFSR